MQRPLARFVVALFLSVVSRGGWGVRAAGMGRDAACAHESGSLAGMPAHVDMSRDVRMDDRVSMGARASGENTRDAADVPPPRGEFPFRS